MNPLTQTHNQRKMNERELEMGVSGTKNSWHMEYRDSAWIFLGGLPYEMTEGDVICLFSQYGEVVHINLIRDHGTGKSKGFGFICYMDQRSTILAVDNLNGVKVLSRMIRVDHVHQYKLPKDLEKLDQDKRKLFEEGCAPKEIDVEVSESSEEENVVKPKEEKRKKEKKKKKRRHSTSSETDSSDAEDDRGKDNRKAIDERKGKDDRAGGKGTGNGWERRPEQGKAGGRNVGVKQDKSLEDRLRDMANYVKDGEGRAGEGDVKRMTAKDMFEKEKRPARVEKSSRDRRSRSDDRNGGNVSRERKARSRSRDRRERSGSQPRKVNYRRSVSAEKQKSRKERRSSSGEENRDRAGYRKERGGRSRSRGGRSTDRRKKRRSSSSSSG